MFTLGVKRHDSCKRPQNVPNFPPISSLPILPHHPIKEARWSDGGLLRSRCKTGRLCTKPLYRATPCRFGTLGGELTSKRASRVLNSAADSKLLLSDTTTRCSDADRHSFIQPNKEPFILPCFYLIIFVLRNANVLSSTIIFILLLSDGLIPSLMAAQVSMTPSISLNQQTVKLHQNKGSAHKHCNVFSYF